VEIVRRKMQPNGGDRPSALYSLEKRLQLYAGRYPAVFYGIHRLARKNPAQTVSPETQLVIEGFPRPANTFAVMAFRQAQKEKTRIAHNLHVPAQIIQASRQQIPALVLIRDPKDAVLSFAVRDPISVDQALKHYISFYETIADYRDDFVLGAFEEVTSGYGAVIERINERFGTTFLPFRHNKKRVERVFDRMEKIYRKGNDATSLEARISRPSEVREKMKRGVRQELEDPRRQRLLYEARAVYQRLVSR
jgi:hypothetical protein